MNELTIGVALGAGAARGWAHIGVLQALAEAGLRPSVVCGTSVGAFVGAVYAADKLDELEAWALSLTSRDVVGLLDVTLSSGGMISGNRAIETLARYVGEVDIEDLPCRFAAVATELGSGREVWLQDGSLLEAVRASISLPGIFTPASHNGRWLVDGGLVNPVPVSTCRALGADIVIAVHLGAERPAPVNGDAAVAAENGGEGPDPWNALATRLGGRWGAARRRERGGPGFFNVVFGALHIMQEQIARSRMAGDVPDILLTPPLRDIRLLDFDEAPQTIDAGRGYVEQKLPEIRETLTRLGWTGSGLPE